MLKTTLPHSGYRILRSLLLCLMLISLLTGTRSTVLAQGGKPWAWGSNDAGQLGDGTNTNRTTPVQVSGLTGVVQVAGGVRHTLALKSDGTVWAWGRNSSGELGDGTTAERHIPVQVSGITGALQVAVGHQHSLAVKSDGTVWAWGYNGFGQLGDGTNNDRNIPFQISGITKIVQVAGGENHSLAAQSDGMVWSWGQNQKGQLGDGTNTNRNTPVQVSGLTSVAQIAAGYYHSLAIGTVKVQDTVSIASNITLLYGKITLVSTLKNKSSGKTIPNRPIAFTLNGNAVGTANTDASGKAYLLVPNSTDYGVGAYPFTTSFAGNALYNPSNASATLTVAKTSTLTTVGATAGSPGETKYLTATLTRSTDSTPLVNQTLTFKLDGVAIGTATTDGTGVASLSYKFDGLSIGSHTLTAKFAGDANQGASAGTGTVTVTPAATTLVANSASGRPGDTVNLVATLTRTSDKAAVAGETVSFSLVGSVVGTALTDSSGKATLAYKIGESFPVGNVTLTASFAGDSNYLTSTSPKRSLTIKKAQAKLAPNNATGKQGATVTLNATLYRTTDKAGIAGRAVRFQIDSVDAGSGTTDGNGVVNVSYTIPSTLTVGKHTITTIFDGDAFYLAYSGSGNTLTVK